MKNRNQGSMIGDRGLGIGDRGSGSGDQRSRTGDRRWGSGMGDRVKKTATKQMETREFILRVFLPFLPPRMEPLQREEGQMEQILCPVLLPPPPPHSLAKEKKSSAFPFPPVLGDSHFLLNVRRVE